MPPQFFVPPLTHQQHSAARRRPMGDLDSPRFTATVGAAETVISEGAAAPCCNTRTIFTGAGGSNETQSELCKSGRADFR
jgi:hypothetical protein